MTAAPEHAPARGGRFPWGLTLAVLICLPILLGLGVWQVQRLQWKQNLLARIGALKSAPPRSLAEVLAEARAGRDVDFVRVTTTCVAPGSSPWLELHSIRDGRAGVRLISVCRAPDGGPPILLDRGFVADIISSRPPVHADDRAPLVVTGVLRRPDPPSRFAAIRGAGDRLWFVRDARAMGAALNAPGVPAWFLMAETSTNPEWKALDPAPLPADIPNNHLGYAITWFGLAAALAAVYAAMLRRRRRRGAAAGPDSV